MNLRVAHVCPICTSMPVPMHPKLNGSFARNMCCMPDMWDKVMRCVRLVWLNVFDQKHPEMSPVAEVRADFEVFGTDFFWPCPSGNPYFDQIRGFITMGKVAGRWYRSKLIMEWPWVAWVQTFGIPYIHPDCICSKLLQYMRHLDEPWQTDVPEFTILPDPSGLEVFLCWPPQLVMGFVACFSFCSSAAQPKDPWRHRHFDRPWAGQGMCWWNERLSSFAEGSNCPNSQWCLADKQ